MTNAYKVVSTPGKATNKTTHALFDEQQCTLCGAHGAGEVRTVRTPKVNCTPCLMRLKEIADQQQKKTAVRPPSDADYTAEYLADLEAARGRINTALGTMPYGGILRLKPLKDKKASPVEMLRDAAHNLEVLSAQLSRLSSELYDKGQKLDCHEYMFSGLADLVVKIQEHMPNALTRVVRDNVEPK